MIGLGITGFITLVIASYMGNLGSVSGKETIKIDQRKIVTQIEKRLREKRNLYTAAQRAAGANAGINKCLGINDAKCTVTSSMTQGGFSLYDANGTRMAGPPNDPVLYSRSGTPNCIIGTPGCPFFQAYTYYWGRCAAGKTCKTANTIYLRYQVVPVVPKYKGIKLSAIPNKVKFEKKPRRQFAISHRLTSRGTSSSQSCPPGSEQTGFGKGGQFECVCRFDSPKIGTNADGQPICDVKDLVCPTKTLLKGMKANGAPLCEVVERKCKINMKLEGDNATCPNGGWMTALNLGTCKAGSGGKKSGNRVIKCDTNRADCCYFEPTGKFLNAVPQ
jgi:hypothetical protein